MDSIKEVLRLRDRFGVRVRGLRSLQRLTQEQLAEKAKISVDFLSLIERGRNSPSFENLETLAGALDVSVAQLFTFEEDDLEAK
jgi:transcriptional regulator with XRE-family HTH domain